MRVVKLVMVAVLVVTLSACISITVDRTWDSRVDFAGVSTYDWAPKESETGPDLPYADIDRVIREAVDEKLADKGYLLSSDNPTFRVTYYVGVEEVTAITEDYYGRGWGGYWGYGWYGATGVNVSQYDQASITIDILSSDPEPGLVWRGIGRGAIDPGARPRRMERGIQLAVDRIFDEFPPQRN